MKTEWLMNIWHTIVILSALVLMSISGIRAWNTSCRNGTLVVLILCSGLCLELYSVSAMLLTKTATYGCIDFYPVMVIAVNGALAATVWYLLKINMDTKPMWTKVAAACYVVVAVMSSVYLNSDSVVEGSNVALEFEHEQVFSTFCHYDPRKIILPILLETVSLYGPLFGLFCYIFWKQTKLKRGFQQTDIKIISPCAGLLDDRTYCDACMKINTEIVILLNVYGVMLLLVRPVVQLYNYVVGGPCTDVIPVIIHLGGCMFLSVLNMYHQEGGTQASQKIYSFFSYLCKGCR